MFEGLVRQLLLGYLGRYVKDIQKEQLKITLWNEEVLLENVELILEAFDYLQLPFALKQGRVGRLSIKIPWKKLGWDPIIIILEDVFINACQRDDEEWSLDAVERREFAGKKAKLAAAELAKLSRRVCDNQAGQSFISYITAKILDSIQVSIRNFHVIYSDKQADSAQIIFGLKFSSLTIMKQYPAGASGRVRGSQVNKIVEIIGFEIYCSMSQGAVQLTSMDNAGDYKFLGNAISVADNYDHMLAPLDISMSLLVNRSGRLDNDAPQYSINAELTGLVLSLDEVQLQQILILCDYLCTCQLREKYGRYRPWSHPLSRKPKGWQKLWWHYAQESVLSDVRKKLRRTSWRYLGLRVSYRRKYVNLYKTKLDYIQKEQSIDEAIIRELEQMEQESDVEDILSYRSAAECELQESLLIPPDSNVEMTTPNISLEKSRNDENLSGRSRGWLNWLSRGMLGAGGTDDSSQFSGVVSDEVIKDIYEATKFRPMVLSNEDTVANNKIHRCSVNFSIHQISVTLRSINSGQEIAELILNGAILECKLWDEFATVIASVDSGMLVYPCNKNVILLLGRSVADKNALEKEQPSCRVQVDSSPNREVEFSVKVVLQPLEVTCDIEFLLNFLEIFNGLQFFKSQRERVLSSLNGIENVQARLLSKAEYIVSSRKKVMWDFTIINFTLNVPWANGVSQQFNMVLELGDFHFISKFDIKLPASDAGDQSYVTKHFSNPISTCDNLVGFQLQDVYSNFELKFNDVAIKIVMPQYSQTTPVLENFHACITLAASIITDESILKQLEVHVILPSLDAHLSPSIYKSVLELITHVDILYSRSQCVLLRNSITTISNQPQTLALGFSITANLESINFHVGLENDGDNSSSVMFSLRELDIRYNLTDFEDGWIGVKALKIVIHPLRSKMDGRVLCSSGNLSATVNSTDIGGFGNHTENFCERNVPTKECFYLHYEANKSVAWQNCTVLLNDADFHCDPYSVALMIGFYDRISAYNTSYTGKKPCRSTGNAKKPKRVPCSELQHFGFSNFFETGSSENASISLDTFPFVTIHNSGHLSSLESSLLYPIPDWRKNFGLRDGKIRSQKCSIKKGSKPFDPPPCKSSSSANAFPSLGSGVTNLFRVDCNLYGVRIHFHDSSCIVGTVTLPTTQSSLFVYEDSMDMLCSIEGLVLTSSWWTQNFCEFLWGPSLPNLSPILNIFVRKEDDGLLSSQLEISISVQHVCCILPPTYLAILIGYFLLPAWRPYSSEQSVSGNHKNIDEENVSAIAYKFEILDSSVICPVESDEHQFLKLEIPQLYISFIGECMPNILWKDVAPECLLPTNTAAEINHSLNIFGRDLFLSFVLCKDDGFGCLSFEQDTACRTIRLFAPVSADLWIRLPCESESSFSSSSSPTCIMVRINNCQINADDCYFFSGLEALMDVVDKYSSIDVEAKGFTSNVLQFLQLRKCLKESGTVLRVASGLIFTEIRCCVESLLVVLHRLSNSPVLLEPVAKVDMQLICSASFRNETLLLLQCIFTSLALCSLVNSIMLAQCNFISSTVPVLKISLSRSGQDENELRISLPSLHVWLHLSDWTLFIDICNSYFGKLSECVPQSQSSTDCNVDNPEVSGSQSSFDKSSMSTYIAPENLKNGTVILIARSDDIGITFHFPIWVSGHISGEFGVTEVQEERLLGLPSDIFEGKDYKCLTITIHSRSSELFIAGTNVKFELNLEKISGSVVIREGKSFNSWPFFQILQFNMETEICNNQTDFVHVNVEVQSDRFDVWLSHQVFYFWSGVVLQVPESESSQSNCIDFGIRIRKVSILLTDGRWSCSRPLLELLMKNFLLHAKLSEHSIVMTLESDVEVNYNNIHKVLWEPFVEPWKFQINMTRKVDTITLLNNSMVTDIDIKSTSQLNLNLTEPLIECVFRTIEMIKEAWGLIEPNEFPEETRLLNPQIIENICAGRYAPYILQNLTSLPLVYHVSEGLTNSDESDVFAVDGKSVQPGSSVPIYLNESPDEQLFRYRPPQSSDRLSEKQSNGVAHHFMTILLDGTSVPSSPISMDLVGLTCFEVDFSKLSYETEIGKSRDASNYNMSTEENARTDGNSGFVIPVVFDVSVQHYSKLIRLYSTVILFNATSLPLEIRFDIPFGVSPKILDPIYPGQEFPLPLHLAESGRMMCRPLGNSYPWSGVHNLSNILSQESKIGFLKSFVCYPSQLSSDPFRCCISVQNVCLPTSGRPKSGTSLCINDTMKHPAETCGQTLNGLDKSKKRFVHQVSLSTPLIVNNYLPEAVSLTIESGGVTRTTLLSEVQTYFHHIDPSHDLGLELHMHGRSSVLTFPRTETFSTVAKFSGTKFSLSDTVIFKPNLQNGPIHVTVEKIMDAFSGARELFIFVPFLLYNCTGFPLIISESANENEIGSTLPSCYELVEHELLKGTKDGLSIFSSDLEVLLQQINSPGVTSSKSHIVSSRKNVNPHMRRFVSKSLISSGFHDISLEQSERSDLGQKTSVNRLNNRMTSSTQLTSENSEFIDNEPVKVKPCMYSPTSVCSASEIIVRLRRCLHEYVAENVLNSSWSSPFLLVPPSGSTNVIVPQTSSNAAFIVSATSSALASPFAGRTQAITFQPRYIISNACSKELCYKQKGTDIVYNFGVGQHSHLHWADTTRELLVSIRFNEPGYIWSGSFLPDHLGDTQIKMRNYLSGALNMIRVEVQNADVSIGDETIVGNLHENSGTNLILLSDDHTGYMPYRIDNFSKERLRIYQQKCETFDTIIHPHNSCPYAWDEPCYPHRLSVEVPGERVLGLYSIDEVKDYKPVYLQSTSEKPERKLILSVHAEGATKVLSIIDPSYHILRDIDPGFTNKNTHEQKHGKLVDYREKISIIVPYVGVSLINSYPQELIFFCSKSLRIDLLQSLDQQKLSFEISSLQIDNQLRATPHPVILSFDREYRSNPTSFTRTKDDAGRTKTERTLQITSDGSCEPVFYLAVAKWRNTDISLVSFEYIIARVADFRLELELEIILSLFDFFRTVSSSFHSRLLPFADPILNPLISDMGLKKESSYTQISEYLKAKEDQLHKMNVPTFNKNHKTSPSLPSIVPIGAPWQQIYLLARRQKKVYVELFDLAPMKLTLSFSSAPWMLRNGVLPSGESLIHRGLMALADVEGARIYLKELTIAHQMASWESIQEILVRHYTRQFLHEVYKVFGSAGVIGNPMGFARTLGVGIRDFLSVPARSSLQSPTGLITGMAQGTTSLVSNTVYAISDAATQFSKAAHKGIVAFTFDDQAVARMDKQQQGVASQSKGVINEVLEGLTGLLQSPIKGAEKHGLPGVLSGMALGVTGLVARPAASILEVTGKTAQSIKNRSRLYQMGPQRYRVRFPRPLSRELPLKPYSWEEAVGTSLLVEADDGLRFKDEVLVLCKALKQDGKFVVITERLVSIVSCSCLEDLHKPEFRGVAVDPGWVIESEIGLDSIIHADTDDGIVHIVGSSSDALSRQNQSKRGSGTRTKRWSIRPTRLPLFQTNLELGSKDDAEFLLRTLLSTIEQGKEQGWGTGYLLHQTNVRLF